MPETRVPLSSPKEGWSLETSLDHVLSVIVGKHELVMTLIAANDKRYEERFQASQRALDAALLAQKEAMTTALVAQQEAVLKAERATEKRFESVNEFRGTLDSQQRTLIPRSEVQEIRRALDIEIVNLTKILDELKVKESNRTFERRGVSGGWGYAVGVVGFVLAILALINAFTSRP